MHHPDPKKEKGPIELVVDALAGFIRMPVSDESNEVPDRTAAEQVAQAQGVKGAGGTPRRAKSVRPKKRAAAGSRKRTSASKKRGSTTKKRSSATKKRPASKKRATGSSKRAAGSKKKATTKKRSASARRGTARRSARK